MADHLMVAFTECQPGADEEFNAWYTGTHLPDVLELDGFTAVQRFRQAPAGNEEGHTYLAIWEIDGDLEEARRRLASGPPRYRSPAYDRSKSVVLFYTAITERIEQPDGDSSGSLGSGP